MTIYYYSASTGGFYTPAIHGTGTPPDVVPVPQEQWSALLDAQSRGMEIRPDENGRPVAVHPEVA